MNSDDTNTDEETKKSIGKFLRIGGIILCIIFTSRYVIDYFGSHTNGSANSSARPSRYSLMFQDAPSADTKDEYSTQYINDNLILSLQVAKEERNFFYKQFEIAGFKKPEMITARYILDLKSNTGTFSCSSGDLKFTGSVVIVPQPNLVYKIYQKEDGTNWTRQGILSPVW